MSGAAASAAAAAVWERNEEATLFVSNLDPRASEELLWELFVQVAPVVSVFLPRDRVSGEYHGYAFVELRSEGDALYAIKVLGGTRLFGRPLKLAKASAQRRAYDIGANVFVGGLAPAVDEARLYQTFSHFGTIISCKALRDAQGRGYGFVAFDSFEAADRAIAEMNGQYLSGRAVSVEYALKKDGRGERHGSAAERLLAANRATVADPDTLLGFEAVDYGRVHELVLPAGQPLKES